MNQSIFLAINAIVLAVLVGTAFAIGRRRSGRPVSAVWRYLVLIWACALLIGLVIVVLPDAVAPLALAAIPASGGLLMLARRREIYRQTGRDDRIRLYMAIAGFVLAFFVVVVEIGARR